MTGKSMNENGNVESPATGLLPVKKKKVGEIVHGARSKHYAARFSDERTREGRRLKAIMNALVEDLGGKDKLSESQRLLLSSIRSRLVIVLAISAHIDKRKGDVLESDGNLIPCLMRGYSTYLEGMRRDLEALHGLNCRKQRKVSLRDYMDKKYRGGK